MIGQLNRRITIKTWSTQTDEAAGVSSVETGSYTVWAKVENRSGSTMFSEQQEQWSYDYKITFRYEKSRPAVSNQTIDYDGKRLVIKSILYADEGNRKYCVARCSTAEILS